MFYRKSRFVCYSKPVTPLFCYRRPNNLVGRVRKFSRSLYNGQDGAGLDPASGGEVVSDGELEDDHDDLKARKSSMAHLRKLKIW